MWKGVRGHQITAHSIELDHGGVSVSGEHSHRVAPLLSLSPEDARRMPKAASLLRQARMSAAWNSRLVSCMPAAIAKGGLASKLCCRQTTAEEFTLIRSLIL